MGFDQYHEPPEELSAEGANLRADDRFAFRRGRGDQLVRAAHVGGKGRGREGDHEERPSEEFKHFGMNLEFLFRRKKDWRAELKEILVTRGDIVKRGEAGEKKVD
jgi:hypothetical protein